MNYTTLSFSSSLAKYRSSWRKLNTGINWYFTLSALKSVYKQSPITYVYACIYIYLYIQYSDYLEGTERICIIRNENGDRASSSFCFFDYLLIDQRQVF